MTSENDRPPAHVLYSDRIENRESSGVALDLWGTIPANMADAYKQLVKTRKAYGKVPDTIEDLKKAMKSHLRSMGILTSKTEENIDRMDRGVVEAGQQPYCLGGSSLILNKIAYVSTISSLGDEGFAPLFYVADYDGVQPELLNSRVPSPSPRGLLMSYPSGPEYEDSPIYELPNPPERWLKESPASIWRDDGAGTGGHCQGHDPSFRGAGAPFCLGSGSVFGHKSGHTHFHAVGESGA